VNFAEAEAYLLSLGNEVTAMKLGLESVSTLLKALGDPQNNYLKVQVAGTNGKGSVCAFLDSICRTAGIKVGLYTSPHLVSITERVRINGEDISREEFARLSTRVRMTLERLVASGGLPSIPTFFEQVTAIALLAFAEVGVQVAILETGLGGRLDATTAANAEICAITRIDLDHQQYLGETIEEIAAEKAAIIHAGSHVVIGEQEKAAMTVILDRCREVGVVPITGCGSFRWMGDLDKEPTTISFETKRRQYWDTGLGLRGEHQVENACTSIILAEMVSQALGVDIPEEAIKRGLEAARHPGRLEYQDSFLFDGAHNLSGAKALAAYLDEFASQPITLLFAAMEDKPVSEMLALLVPRVERIVFTESSNERSLSYHDLLNGLPAGMSREKVFVTDSVDKAIAIAETVSPEGGTILVTGSLYLVGEVKKLLNNP
jgi:dihydrofolate synthase/folylpolyglutamate synthase